MKRDRIQPPYKAYVLRANGTRRPLDAYGIVIELRPGIEVEIDFAPSPGFAGHLVMSTPPCARMSRLYEEGKVDDFAVIFGASNILHVLVERRIQAAKSPTAGARRKATRPKRGTPAKRGRSG